MANKLSAREHTVRMLDKFDRSSNRLSTIFENYFEKKKVVRTRVQSVRATGVLTAVL